MEIIPPPDPKELANRFARSYPGIKVHGIEVDADGTMHVVIQPMFPCEKIIVDFGAFDLKDPTK